MDRVGDVTKVTVYSNQPSVELLANGVSLGVKEAADHFFYFDVPNQGTTHLVARAGELTDEGEIRKVAVFNEEYRLKEKGAILNWFDITQPEGCLSLNSKLSDILATTRGKLLLGGLFAKVMLSGGKDGKSKGPGGFQLTEGMMQMMGGFTLLRLVNMMGLIAEPPTKEQLLDLNAKLNKIKMHS